MRQEADSKESSLLWWPGEVSRRVLWTWQHWICLHGNCPWCSGCIHGLRMVGGDSGHKPEWTYRVYELLQYPVTLHHLRNCSAPSVHKPLCRVWKGTDHRCLHPAHISFMIYRALVALQGSQAQREIWDHQEFQDSKVRCWSPSPAALLPRACCSKGLLSTHAPTLWCQHGRSKR